MMVLMDFIAIKNVNKLQSIKKMILKVQHNGQQMKERKKGPKAQ